MRINERPFPEYGETEAYVDPMYEVAWRLPDLLEPPPTSYGSSDIVCVIPLFSDAYTRLENIETFARHALYSRWTALHYTDAVDNGVAIKFLVEQCIKDRVIHIFENNFIDVDNDVLFFNADPLSHSKDGAWGYLGKQMQPYWDQRLMGHEWVWIWDADILFLPEEHTKDQNDLEKTLPNKMFEKTFNLPKKIGYIYASVQDYSIWENHHRNRLAEDTEKSGLSVDELFEMSGVSTHLQTIIKPMCSMAVYPAKHFHTHHLDWVRWMKSYGPYWGNDEIIAGFWANKFGLDIMHLCNYVNVLMNDVGYYFDTSPPGNVLHGKISMRHEKQLREVLKIK